MEISCALPEIGRHVSFHRFAIDKVFNAAYVWGKEECMQAVKKVLYDNLDEIPATDLLTQIDIELSK